MLVLTRKTNQSFMIGNDIRIVVVAIRDNKVRLGIEAPSELQVVRDDAKVKAATPEQTIKRAAHR